MNQLQSVYFTNVVVANCGLIATDCLWVNKLVEKKPVFVFCSVADPGSMYNQIAGLHYTYVPMGLSREAFYRRHYFVYTLMNCYEDYGKLMWAVM